MAELGIAASIIAVIDLAAKTTELTREYVNGVKRAPSDLRKLLDELTALAEVFSALHDCTSANPTNGLVELGIFKDKDGPLRECILELEKLQRRLESKEGWRRVVTRLKWPLREKETMEFILRIERHKSLFGLAIDADQLSRARVIETCVLGIETGVQGIRADINNLKTESATQTVERQREDAARIAGLLASKRSRILTWLYPEAFDKKHLEISDRRQKNTGNWILEEPEVQGWMRTDRSSRILWGYGISGAGKTFLSSLMIDHLLGQATIARYGVAYIYFDYNGRNQQQPVQVLASLIKQLACQVQYLPEEIQDLYERLESQQKRPTLDELYHILLVVITSFHQTFVVCDALDECDPKAQRKELLPLFHRMGGDGMNLFLTSREYPEDIQVSLQDSVKVRIWAREEDIIRYIKQKIEENPRAKRLVEQENCKDRIISELTACAKGMFLFVHFHIEYLCQQTTVGQILAELERLKISSAEDSLLNPTYSQAMDRLLDQPKSCRDLAIKTLSWLVKARRILTFRELQMAVSVQDEPTLSSRDMPDEKTLLHVCASLVTIDENSGTVGLAHYTVQEYLLKNSIFVKFADPILATTCITFLSLDVFTQGPCSSLNALNDRHQSYPFLDYAAQNLSYHLKACSEDSTNELVLSFLQNQDRLSSYLQALHAPRLDTYEQNCYDWYPTGRSSLHIAASLGHAAAVRYLLMSKETLIPVNAVDEYGQTALHLAASAGNDAVVRVLLERGADVSISDKKGRTALFRAAVKGHETIARLLLDAGAYFSASRNSRRELCNAICRGQVMVLRLLLEKRIDASALITKRGETALHIAAAYGRPDPKMIHILLQSGCDLAIRDNGGNTALSHAASWGHEEVMRLLLENGADISTLNNEGRTPLHQATCAYKQREGVVQLLIEKGANLMAIDHNGQTALHIAASTGYEAAVKLLGKDSCIMAQDKNGHTPLHLAVSRRYKATAMLLLKQGADPFALDKHNHSALDLAILNGHQSMVQLLLEKNPRFIALASSGLTALHLAASNGYVAAVALLLEEVVDPFVKDNNGRTAVQLAAYNGHTPVVQLFLEKYNKAFLENEERSILHQAAAGGNRAVVQLILERGVDVSAVTIKGGWTALHWAVYKEKEVVVRLLLEKGGNPFAEDQNGQTPVHLAALNWNESMVRLLLGIGLEGRNANILGQTTLHLAASKGYEAPVQLLLKKGVDPLVVDVNGHTALHLADLNGHESVVRLLSIAERRASLAESSSEGYLGM